MTFLQKSSPSSVRLYQLLLGTGDSSNSLLFNFSKNTYIYIYIYIIFPPLKFIFIFFFLIPCIHRSQTYFLTWTLAHLPYQTINISFNTAFYKFNTELVLCKMEWKYKKIHFEMRMLRWIGGIQGEIGFEMRKFA
jgi:hypothetical protein